MNYNSDLAWKIDTLAGNGDTGEIKLGESILLRIPATVVSNHCYANSVVPRSTPFQHVLISTSTMESVMPTNIRAAMTKGCISKLVA